MSGALRRQVWKELRALLPWWGAVVVAIFACGQAGRLNTMSLGDLQAVWSAGLLAFVAGSVALGAMSIGHEYTYRTLPALLAQPISRARLLGTKLAVLALLLAGLSGL